MKMKKVLAIGLSATMIMAAVPVYADEADLVAFEDSADSAEETSDESIIFDESEYDEDTSEPENFDPVDEEHQMSDNETENDNDFLFSDGTDEIQMVGIAADNTAPVIESITIDKHDVTVGDTVTVTAVITDESGVKNFPYIGFYKTGSQSHTMNLKPQGNNIYKGSIIITEDFVNGIYPAEWCNLEDIYSNGSTDYSFDQKYPDLYFRVLCDNHIWNQGAIIQNATCTDNGERKYTCTVCEATKTEVIPATGHKKVIDPAVSPTCESTGKTEGSHCSVCGKVFVAQNVVKATGHAWDEGKVTKEATCEEAGIKTYTCATCGLTKTEDIKALGHKEVKDAAVAATCETDGLTEGSHCSVCGKVLVIQNVVKATGHTWDEGKVTKEATCEESGIKTYTCASCESTKTEDIKALGHKEVKDAAVAATCVKDGLTEGSYCSVCNKVLTEQKKVPATGHKFRSWKTTSQATVFSPEQQSRSCSVCGKNEKREVGSKLQKTMTVSATSLPLKTKQKTTVLKVSGLAAGDSIISWKSSNTKVAKVSGRANGTSTITAGNKKGTAKITITLKSGLQKVVKVTVQKSAVKTKKITGVAKNLKLNKTQKAVLRPVIAPLTSKQKITYKSSNAKVASVNSKGQITAKKKGTAVITVKSGSKTVKCKVTVK